MLYNAAGSVVTVFNATHASQPGTSIIKLDEDDILETHPSQQVPSIIFSYACLSFLQCVAN